MNKELVVADKIEPFVVQTLRDEKRNIPDAARPFWHLQFRRFAGCPICNLHLQSFVKQIDRIQEGGIHELVFFHSSAEEMSLYQHQLPFDVVADPEKNWYRRFGVGESIRAIFDPRSWLAGVQGIMSGNSDVAQAGGGRLGLPADFLVNGEGRIVALKYGLHADDQWSVDELLTHAARRS